MWLICLWIWIALWNRCIYICCCWFSWVGVIWVGFIWVGFIWFGCGLFVIAIGLILSKISFILNCGVSGSSGGFTGCLFEYSNVGITTDGLNIIDGCYGCFFLFLSLFSLECVLLPILKLNVYFFLYQH